MLKKKKKKKGLKEWGMSREHRGQLESALSGQVGTEETHQVSVEMTAKRQMQAKA